jgi:hypothetical protein
MINTENIFYKHDINISKKSNSIGSGFSENTIGDGFFVFRAV